MINVDNRITPDNIEKIKPFEIFVFGSNLRGIHGAGSAKFAFENRLTSYGKYYGLTLNNNKGAFAIPTKGLNIETLSLDWIKYFIDNFIQESKKDKSFKFLVTKIGCGLAGYKPEQIAPLFKTCLYLDNIHLPKDFWNIIIK